VEYRENKAQLVSRLPVAPMIEELSAPEPMRKRVQVIRRRRSTSSRVSGKPAASNSVIVLALTPRGEFD
jgi:hypothetical protein